MRSTSILLTCITLLLTATLQAQIPNPGFEELNSCYLTANWSYAPLQVIIIDSLGHEYTDSVQYDSVPHYTYPSTDAHSGTYALGIRNAYSYTYNQVYTGKSDVYEDTSNCSGFFSIPIPLSYTPASLNFYHKFTPVGGDTAYCYAALYDSNGVEIATAIHYFVDPAPVYTAVQIPFTYLLPGTAAYYTIRFNNMINDYQMHTSHFGTRLYIDDISFGMLNGVENPEDISLNIYPNPAVTDFRIQSSITLENVRLLTMNGAVVRQYNPQEQQYQVGDLPAGIYMLEMSTGTHTYYRKVVKSHQ